MLNRQAQTLHRELYLLVGRVSNAKAIRYHNPVGKSVPGIREEYTLWGHVCVHPLLHSCIAPDKTVVVGAWI